MGLVYFKFQMMMMIFLTFYVIFRGMWFPLFDYIEQGNSGVVAHEYELPWRIKWRRRNVQVTMRRKTN